MAGMRIGTGCCRCFLSPAWRAVTVAARSAGRSETALGVQQEYPCGDDLLAFLQAVPDLDAIRELGPDDDGTGLELVAGDHENVLLQSCVDDRVARYGDDVQASRFEHRRSVQTRPERTPTIGGREAHSKRARAIGQRGIHEINPCPEGRTP